MTVVSGMSYKYRSVVSLGLSVVSGQWSVVSGQWSVVSGQWSVVSGQWSVVSVRWSVSVVSWSVVICILYSVFSHTYIIGNPNKQNIDSKPVTVLLLRLIS